MSIKISTDRYKQLLDSENRLIALESNGVDNWEFYEEALKEYNKKKWLKEAMDDCFEQMLSHISESIEEPAGRGCGYGFTRDSESLEKAADVLSDFILANYEPKK